MTLDQYEEEMALVNEQQYERMTMKADDDERFNQMMEESNKEMEKARIAMKQTEVERGGVYLSTDPGAGAVDKAVNQPTHYQFIDMTVEELIEAGLTHEELMGWFKGNVIKYRMRAFKKGKVGPQDIAKANEYQTFYDEYKSRNQPR